MNFVGEFKEKPKKIFLVHGEEEAQNVLKGKIEEEYGIETEIPSFGDVFRVDEIVEKEENLLGKEKVVATREEKIEFANKVSDLNEELTTNTDKTILEEVLVKLNKLEKTINLMLKETEKKDKEIVKEENTKKDVEEITISKNKRKKKNEKLEEIDDIDDII